MADAFKAGDVVQLKSGGPLMTIYSVVDGKYAQLIWFESGSLHLRIKDAEQLPLDVLKHAPQSSH